MSINRLEFAHQLRAIAALVVVVSHYLGVFWLSPVGVGYLIGVPPLAVDGASLPGAGIFMDMHVFLGHFGVAIFFLTSGFVIPLTLERKSIRAFIIERVFRIYPVYLVGFTVCILSSLLVSFYFSGTYNFSFSQVFVHYFLIIREWIGSPKIDGISWTLEIELKFYLYTAFVMTVLRKKYAMILVISAILFFALSVDWYTQKSTWYIGRQMASLQYMYIGVALSFYYLDYIKLRFLVTYFLVNIILFTVVFTQTHIYHAYAGWLEAYWVAAAVFVFFFYARSHFRSSLLLSFFADISYPLYVTHALSGYALLYFLMKNNVYPWAAVIITFLTIVAISALVHLLVEKPAMQFGRRIAGNYSGMMKRSRHS